MEKDIRDKVCDFGEVSKVLIKKDSARGFGFVNFRPPEEARNECNGGKLSSHPKLKRQGPNNLNINQNRAGNRLIWALEKPNFLSQI